MSTSPQPVLAFWGGSFIADPFGRIFARASHDEEEIFDSDLDPVKTTRQHRPSHAAAASTPTVKSSAGALMAFAR
jgi:predicted amidohydrolase